MSDDGTRPFPIQGGRNVPERRTCGDSTVPWWLAEVAYEYYAELYGRRQSLERLAQRGGFGRDELIALLRRDKHDAR